MPPHNLPLTVIGAGLLWFGWFGFNAGSALAPNGLAALRSSTRTWRRPRRRSRWMAAEWCATGRPTMLGVAPARSPGSSRITPAAGFVTPLAALVIGVLAGVVCYGASGSSASFGYDDALDVFGVHGVGGTLGALLTGVFATKDVNSAIPTLTLGLDGGLLYGYPSLMVKQIIAIVATYVFCGLGTFLLLSVINAIIPLRAEIEDERMGLDLSQHSETAYS